MDRDKVRLRNSISVKLLRSIFGIYCIVALTITVAHLGYEYFQIKNNVHRHFILYQNSLEKSLNSEVWHLDYTQLDNTLSGVIGLPFMVGVSVHLPDGTVYARKGQVSLNERNIPLSNTLLSRTGEDSIRFSDDLFSHSFDLADKYSGAGGKIGSVQFYSSNSVVLDQLGGLFWSIVVASILKTAVLWVLFIYFGQKLLGRPLNSMVNYVYKLPLDKMLYSRASRISDNSSELQLLDDAMHTMSERLNETLNKLNSEIGQRRLANRELEVSRQNLEGIVEDRTAELAEKNAEIATSREKLQLALDEISSLIQNVTSNTDTSVRLSNPHMQPCYEVKDCNKTDCTCYGAGPARCWQVAGTYCGGKIQGAFAQKYLNCSKCEVYLRAASDPIHEIGEQFNNMMHVIEMKSEERYRAEAATRESEERFRAVAETANDAIISADSSGNITFWNGGAEKMFGYSAEEAGIMSITEIIPERFRDDHLKGIMRAATDEKVIRGRTVEVTGLRKDGAEFFLEISLALWEINEKKNFTAIMRNITDRKKAEESLKNSQATILQQEKMASIGQLAAGVAHEINNPMGFITSNLRTLGRYSDRLAEFNTAQSEIVSSFAGAEVIEKVEALNKKLKVDLIKEDLSALVEESLEGAERVKVIVQNLKSFSRVDEAEFKSADINECMESTLNIVWNEIKYRAEVIKEYGDIPMTRCYPQQLNQVFMNLLVNAAHSIAKQGEIRIRTWNGNGQVNVSISDTGCGMSEGLASRIFEPFYTTKEVGKGTGLGLSIAYDIVNKHEGEINVDSEEGKGTTMTVSIPVT